MLQHIADTWERIAKDLEAETGARNRYYINPPLTRFSG